MGASSEKDDAPTPASPAAPLAYDTTRVLTPGAESRPVAAASSSPAGAPPIPGGDSGARAVATVRLGRYELGRVLGQGGMGVVYRARDRELDRALAIKLVRSVADDPSGARVLREAQAMARLRHPGVVPVFDVGVHDGNVFLVMPLLEGGTLGGWLRATRRPWRDIVTRFLAAARGLAAAHAVGLVHRDFKPDNVLLGAGDEVQVADFGLARATHDVDGPAPGVAPTALATNVTAEGTVLGTPAYMAPEQLDGAVVDAKADQFSFCVALYEGLYGHRPFDDDARTTDLMSLRQAIRTGPVRPGKPEGDVPGWLRAIVLRGLREDPAARWPSMTALAAAIERRLHRGRRLALIGLAGLALVGVAAVAVMASGAWRGGGARKPDVFAIDRATRVTFAGCAAQPAFVPDGDGVAYVQRRGSASTLMLSAASGGAGRALGAGTEPAFSPDGHYLAALDKTQVVVHDLRDSAAAPRTLGPSTSGPVWLDAETLVVGVGDRIVARALADGAERVLGHVPDGHVVRAIAVGVDHRIFVIHRPDATLAEAVVAEVKADGTTRELRRGVLSTAGVRYRADRGVVYYVQRRNTNQYQLFVQALDGAEPTPVATDTPPSGGFDVAADGHRLAFSSCAESATIAVIARGGAPIALTGHGAWRDNGPLAVDAARLVHTSTRSGLLQLWLLDRTTGDDAPLVPPESSNPALSPDRTTLVYATVEQDSMLGLRTAPLDALAAERTLTTGHVDRAARFTRDGDAVVFLRETPVGLGLYRVDAGGGPALPLEPAGGAVDVRAFDVSPLDDTVALIVPADPRSPLSRMALTGGEREPVVAAASLSAALRTVRYAPDGRRLLLVDGDGRLLELTLATGALEPRWQLAGSEYSAVGAVDYDLDGDTILASLTSRAGDLWIADGRF